ncbi:hypothetical protein T4D_10651 [Trichinella pseudospiralis]|uniref:Uncharacterized protein n=1 Tax=Trichinella pseudospiralis TaxID=6337 RepID=A0A0V1FBW5_TRIPS|nr:hypothetical protein T4D_10651 [Trichinella pseudospiralis]
MNEYDCTLAMSLAPHYFYRNCLFNIKTYKNSEDKNYVHYLSKDCNFHHSSHCSVLFICTQQMTEDLKIFTSICDGMQCEGIKELDAGKECWYFNSSSFANVKVKWIFELKTNDDWAASQSHMALKAGCCVLAFPFGRVSCFAYHEKNGRQRFGQIDAVNVLVGVVFNAFPNCGLCHLIKSESMSLPGLLCLRLSRIGMKALEMWLHKHHWLRKQSTGYGVSLHQTTVVVQVVRNCEDEGRILTDMHRITIDQCTWFCLQNTVYLEVTQLSQLIAPVKFQYSNQMAIVIFTALESGNFRQVFKFLFWMDKCFSSITKCTRKEKSKVGVQKQSSEAWEKCTCTMSQCIACLSIGMSGKYKIWIGVKDQITKSDRKSQTKRKKEKTTNTIQLAKHARKIMQIFIVYANT